MKRTKPPALTSPSKIGFFVSLMLVFVSVGVSYFFIHEYGVSWNWLDRNEWLSVIKGEGFLFDVLPLLAVVAVSSLISYLMITGAVRKYKRYLDSGFDYKNLLSTLKDIDNLEDRSKIDKLKNHPDLKRLLLGISEDLATRNRELDEHHARFEQEAADAVNAREEELNHEFSRQCDLLVDAITTGAGSHLDTDRDVSDPGLTRVREAVQQAIRAAETPAASELADSYGDLRKTSHILRSRLHEIAEEMNESSEAARRIEEQITRLAGTGRRDSDRDRIESAKNEVQNILGHLRSLEELSNSMEVLSEEAKGVAISTALQAGSGEGTQDDLIRLAEEVKEVAGRFKDATRRFSDVSIKLRPSMGVLEAVVGGETDPRGEVSSMEQSLAALGTKASLWVERVVVLSDKICNLRELYDVSVTGHSGAASDEVFETAESTPRTHQMPDQTEMSDEIEMSDGKEKTDESDEYGFETLDRSRSIFAGSADADAFSGDGIAERTDEGIFEGTTSEREAMADVSDDERDISDEPAQPGDGPLGMPGFETFSTGVPFKPSREHDTPPKKDVLGIDDDRWQPGLQETEADEEHLHDTADPTPSDRRGLPTTEYAEQTEEQEEVTDLYALGAVDYDPAVHG